MAKSFETEDHAAVARRFLPTGAQLIAPQYPPGSKIVQPMGTSRHPENLLASYRHEEGLKTIILEKTTDGWKKAAEIDNPGYDTVNYRSFLDLTGEGKKSIVLGLTKNGKDPVLYGYLLDGGNAIQLFACNYSRFQVLKPRISETAGNKAYLAVWNKTDLGTYSIEVLHWNGARLETTENLTRYYCRKIMPYIVRMVKRAPYKPSNWYSLANTLTKAGLNMDALQAIEIGMKLDPDPALREKFVLLNKKIIES